MIQALQNAKRHKTGHRGGHHQEVAEEGEGLDDLSDEAMLARHEEVLKKMRDKWAAIQQLKMECG